MDYLAIDLGTTVCKAVLYRESGERVLAAREYPLYTEGEAAEQEAADWWTAVRECVLELTGRRGGAEIGALCVGGQGITVLPVDGCGVPLRRAVTWLDRRGDRQRREILRRFTRGELFAVTGKFLSNSYTLPKLLWLREREETLFDRTQKFLFPCDYLNYRLTGRFMTDYTSASGSMLFDVRNRCWSQNILDAFGIPREKLSDVAEMGTPLGPILPAAAEELGISSSARVVLGGQDQKLAALGAGITPGTAAVSLGTAAAVSTLEAVASASVFALNAGQDIYESVLDTAGGAIRWLKGILGAGSYRELDRLAEEAGGSAGIRFFPDLTSGGKLTGLRLSSVPGNIVSALYEGIAEEIAGRIPPKIGKLILYGGGAKSGVLCRKIGAAAKLPVFLPETAETACLGAAMLASRGNIRCAEVRSLC